MKITLTAYQGTDETTNDHIYLVVLEPAEGEVPDTKAMRDAAACMVTEYSTMRFATPQAVLYDIATGVLPSGEINDIGRRFLERDDTIQLWQIEHSGALNPNHPGQATIH